MKAPSEAITRMRRSGIREVFDLASTIPDAIHLEMGEPNFPTPTHVVEAAAAAAEAGYTKYTPNAGLPVLREALAEKISTRNGLAAEPSSVLVTPGAIASLFAAFLTVCDPGDEVLIPDPGWPNYAMIARLQGLRPVGYPVEARDGWTPSAERIEPLIGERTKVLLVNSPSNPVGGVSDAATLGELMSLAEAHDLWVVSDEVYDEICFDGSVAPSIARFGDPGRVITVWSFSKTYAMTGWRVGYTLAPRSLSELIVKTQEPITACVNAPAQMAALAAVTGPQEAVASMRDAYRERRDATVAALSAAGIPHASPHGAFYVWIDVSASGLSSLDFAKTLLTEAAVAVTPGDAFGQRGEGFVRVSLASDPDLLGEGIRRMVASLVG